VSPSRSRLLTNKFFYLHLGTIIRDPGLRKPIYQNTATSRHFGRDDIEFHWEH
jgi:S-adenosylmethionine synthetase